MKSEKWYKYQLEPISEVKWATILKGFVIKTDGKINRNRLDIADKIYKIKMCVVIYLSVPTIITYQSKSIIK